VINYSIHLNQLSDDPEHCSPVVIASEGIEEVVIILPEYMEIKQAKELTEKLVSDLSRSNYTISELRNLVYG
jgi:hypothetical protein